MKRFGLIIPIMIIVAFLAMWLIEKKYAEVPFDSRILIAEGGSILSGIIAYFLLKNDVHKVDEKPVVSNKKKRWLLALLFTLTLHKKAPDRS